MNLGNRILTAYAASAAALVVMAACGGSSPTSPGGGGGGGSAPIVQSTGSVGTVGATITIGTNASVSPSQVTVAVGQSVTFINNDTRPHQMESDPHPAHTNCPSIANVGFLQPGAQRTTFGFAGTGTCGYHDHGDPSNNGLLGRIVIQ